ncbi:MAG: hypothetical protein COB36_11650 [Alphaproteobacteria bacterium]|nr:MAG: hypothetical protein COB36_11650 [Alphaproteobacteria bacterium]
MARTQESIPCPSGMWTQITNGDVENITFQVQVTDVRIAITAGAVAPTGTDGFFYKKGWAEARRALTDYTALVGANRVWARPIGTTGASVLVDHV